MTESTTAVRPTALVVGGVPVKLDGLDLKTCAMRMERRGAEEEYEGQAAHQRTMVT